MDNTKRELYRPFVSTAKHKKYSVLVKSDNKSGKKIIHFGDKRYEQYEDKIGHYKSQNHFDKKRRELYFKRHGKTTDKNSAKWWSNNYLW